MYGDKDSSYLSYLLNIDEHVNSTMYYPMNRFRILIIALRKEKGEDLGENQRAFLRAIIERTKTRHFGGTMIRKEADHHQYQELLFNDIFSTQHEIPIFTPEHWKEVDELRTKHLQVESKKREEMPQTLRMAYEVFYKLASPGAHYAYPDIRTSKPAFPHPKSATIPSSCTYYLADESFDGVMDCLEDEEGLLALLHGVEKLGLLEAVMDLSQMLDVEKGIGRLPNESCEVLTGD